MFFLLVGLGNPGSEYSITRHNVGFMVIDAIAETFNFPNFANKFSSLISIGTIGIKHKIILLKPGKYMNNSGQCVLQALSYYKIQKENIIVFHDDIDLKDNVIKIKKGGNDAGHRGLRSIDQSIGKDYWRVRFGVNRPQNNEFKVADYVLSKFSDLQSVNLQINNIVQNIMLLIEGKHEEFLNQTKLSSS